MKRMLFLVAILAIMSVTGCRGATATPSPTATPAPTATPLPPTPIPKPTPTPITVSGIIEALTPSTVLIYAEFPDGAQTGTGIIYDESGLAVTNAHVVEGAPIIKAYIQGIDRWLSARLVGLSTCEDLAVIDISGEDYVPATFGESDELTLGEEVIALGYPLASSLGAEPTINRGVVSKLHAQLDELQDLIQTDTDINPGNSGGPLVNMRGEVIGVNTIKIEYTSSGRPVSGLNFAIASSYARPIIETLAAGENLHWLGANAIINDADVASYFGLPVEEGLFIYAVSDQSPAADTGLEAGDVLITMKGINVNSMADVCDVLRSNPEGRAVAVQVMRGTNVLEGEIWGERLSVVSQAGPAIGPFTFADAVDENGNCLNPTTTFPPGITKVYTCFSYAGMQDGMAVHIVWLLDGQTYEEADATWEWGPEGDLWWWVGAEEGLDPGQYEAQLYVEGQLMQSDTFAVEAAEIGPTIGPFTFAEAVDENDNCLNPTTTFPAGTMRVYACWNYSGMQDGVAVRMVWLLDGKTFSEGTDTWGGGPEGHWWWWFGAEEGGLDPGQYEAQFYVEDQLVQSGTFAVTALQTTPLFYDDFSDPSSGWDVISEEDREVGYSNGEYYILVKNPSWVAWSISGQTFADFRLEVDTLKVAGPDNNDFGVIVRFLDDDNFYRFRISSDGYYSVVKLANGEWKSLVDWTASPHINLGESTNYITLIAQGSNFSFYVNGERLVDVEDTSLAEGDIGLFAGTFDEAGVEIHFDNLEAWALQ